MYETSSEDFDESGPSRMRPRGMRADERSPKSRDKSYPHEEMWRRLTSPTWKSKMKKMQMTNPTENMYASDKLTSKTIDDDTRSDLAAMEHIRQHILGKTGCGVLGHFHKGFDPVASTSAAFESASWMEIVMQFLQSKELKRAVRSWMNIPITQRSAVTMSDVESDPESACTRGLPAPNYDNSIDEESMDGSMDAIFQDGEEVYHSKRNLSHTWRGTKDCDDPLRSVKVHVDSQVQHTTLSPDSSAPSNISPLHSCHAVVQTNLPNTKEYQSVGTDQVTLVNSVSIKYPPWARKSSPCLQRNTSLNSESRVRFQERNYPVQTEKHVVTRNPLSTPDGTSNILDETQASGATNSIAQNTSPTQAQCLQISKENMTQRGQLATSKSSCVGPSQLVSRTTSMTIPESHISYKEIIQKTSHTLEKESLNDRQGGGLRDQSVFTTTPSSGILATSNTQTSANLTEVRKLRHWGRGVNEFVTVTTRPAQTGPMPITQKQIPKNSISVQTFPLDRKLDIRNAAKDNSTSQTEIPVVFKIPIKRENGNENYALKSVPSNIIHRSIIQKIISKLRTGEQFSSPDSKDGIRKNSVTRQLQTSASNLHDTHSKGNVKRSNSLLSCQSNRPQGLETSLDSVERRRSHSTSRESTALMQAFQKTSTHQIATQSHSRNKSIQETLRDKLPIRSISIPRKLQRPRYTAITSVSSSGTQTSPGLSSRPIPLYEQRRMLAFLPNDPTTRTKRGTASVNLLPSKSIPQQSVVISTGNKRTNRSPVKNKTLHQAVHKEERTVANFVGRPKITNKEMPHVPKNNIVITKRTLSVPIRMASSLVQAQRLQIEVNKSPVRIQEIPSELAVSAKVSADDTEMLPTIGYQIRESTPFYSRKAPISRHQMLTQVTSTICQSDGRCNTISRGTTPPESMSNLQIPEVPPQDVALSSVQHPQTSTPMDISAHNSPMRSVSTSPTRVASEKIMTAIPPPSPSEALKPTTPVQPEKRCEESRNESQTTSEECQTDLETSHRGSCCPSPSACRRSSQLARHVLDVLHKQREYVDSHFTKLAETCETLISSATKTGDSQEQLKKVASICRSLLRVTAQSRKSKPVQFDLNDSEDEVKCALSNLIHEQKHRFVDERQIHSLEEFKEPTKQKHSTSAGSVRNSRTLSTMPQTPPPYFCKPPNDEPLPPQSLDPSALPRIPCPCVTPFSQMDSIEKPIPEKEKMKEDPLGRYISPQNYGWIDHLDFITRRSPTRDPWVLEAKTSPSRMRNAENNSKTSSRSGKYKRKAPSSVGSRETSGSRGSSVNSRGKTSDMSSKNKNVRGKRRGSTVKSQKKGSIQQQRKSCRRGSSVVCKRRSSCSRRSSGEGQPPCGFQDCMTGSGKNKCAMTRGQVGRPSSGVASRKRRSSQGIGNSKSKTLGTSSSQVSSRRSKTSGSKSSKRSSTARSSSGKSNSHRNEKQKTAASAETKGDTSVCKDDSTQGGEKKQRCVCKKELGSSEESLYREKCEAACASRGRTPQGKMTPCSLRALRDRQGRASASNAEDSAMAGSSGTSATAARSGQEGGGYGSGSGRELSQDRKEDHTCHPSCTQLCRTSKREDECSSKAAGMDDGSRLSARTALLSVYLARRGFFKSPRFKAMLSDMDGHCDCGEGLQLYRKRDDFDNMNNRYTWGCNGCRRCGVLENCIACRDVTGNSRYSQGAAAHVPNDFPRWKCEMCRSDDFTPFTAKCQIPVMEPEPHPPMKLIHDLGPMQGPLGRAPFAPPPFLPCCAPPTNIGSVIGPCPIHGSVSTSPQFVPLWEPPMVSCDCNPCCGNIWN